MAYSPVDRKDQINPSKSLSGSVSENVTVTFTQQITPFGTLPSLGESWLSAASVSQNLVFAGQAFNLQAVDNLGNPVTTFLKPYTLTLDYTDREWENAGITDEATLNITNWDVGDSEWVGLLPCTGCWLDLNANRFSVQFDGIGDFAVFGEIIFPVYLPVVLN